MNQDLPSKLVEDVVSNLIQIAIDRKQNDHQSSSGIEQQQTESSFVMGDNTDAANKVSACHEKTMADVIVDAGGVIDNDILSCQSGDASSSLSLPTTNEHRRLILLTLLRLRGIEFQPVKVLTCRQTWVAGGAQDVNLFVYDLMI
jgi:hypothetical protein